MPGVNPIRVIIKAAVLFAAFNLAFAYLDPPIGRLSIYKWLVPARPRLPFEDAEDETLGHNLMLYEDFDAMLSAHQVSTPKPPGEFRVILLGDSSIWGYNLPAADTLAEQLNSRGQAACGRSVRVYNLGYVGLSAPKDLLLLEHVLPYHPDLIIWFVTLKSLSGMGRANILEVLAPHSSEALRLIQAYDLNIETADLHPPNLLERTAVGQRARLKKIAILQLDGLLWGATGIDFYIQDLPAMPADMEADPGYGRDRSGRLDPDGLLLDVLDAGYQMAGDTPVLVVNEPIFVAPGRNRDIRYDVFYPRWAYDQYREYLGAWMQQNGRAYLDLWDLVPPADFGETPLHLTAAGEAQLATRIAAELAAAPCR
jgi:hypothetical protein